MESIANEFFLNDVPEIRALTAVQTLQQLHRSEKVKAISTPYPGKRTGFIASDFLRQHYSDDIASGRLGPGRLETIDSALYHAVRFELSTAQPPRTIRELFDEIAGGDFAKVKPTQRRSKAMADLLETSEEQAVRFFSGARVDRLGGR